MVGICRNWSACAGTVHKFTAWTSSVSLFSGANHDNVRPVTYWTQNFFQASVHTAASWTILATNPQAVKEGRCSRLVWSAGRECRQRGEQKSATTGLPYQVPKPFLKTTVNNNAKLSHITGSQTRTERNAGNPLRKIQAWSTTFLLMMRLMEK